MNERWTTPDDVRSTLTARWRRGGYLRAYAAGSDWQQVRLTVRGPAASDVMSQPARVDAWAKRFADVEPLAVERRTVRTKTLGANELPARIRIDTFDDLVQFLRVRNEVAALDAVLAVTRDRAPTLTPWIERSPLVAIDLASRWLHLIDVVEWVTANPHAGYLRHIDVPGVDTKFVEAHQAVLAQLLALALPPDRVDASARTFNDRFGFLSKPRFTRLRLLDRIAPFPSTLTELQLRTDELARLALDVSTVFVVENEITYLAFPAVPDAIVVFGGGFAVTVLEDLPWLADRRVVYWGDIDTHGFVMLDRIRERFPRAESILMDLATLTAHEAHLTREDQPARATLSHLTPDEARLYSDLVEDRFGKNIRLEQERVRFSAVRAALS